MRSRLIYRDFAQVLINDAKELYHDDYSRLGLEEIVYALDSATIRLCLDLFPVQSFIVEKEL